MFVLFQRVAGLNGVQYVLVTENGHITPLNKPDNLHLVQETAKLRILL